MTADEFLRIVNYILRLTDDGMSDRTICDNFNDDGVPVPFWIPSNVKVLRRYADENPNLFTRKDHNGSIETG